MPVTLGVCWKTAMLPGTQNSRAEGSRKRRQGVLVTLASKGARKFLTADLGAAADGKLLQFGAVGEDGDVTWHTAAARKVRGNVVKGGTGYPSQQGCAKVPHRGSLCSKWP